MTFYSFQRKACVLSTVLSLLLFLPSPIQSCGGKPEASGCYTKAINGFMCSACFFAVTAISLTLTQMCCPFDTCSKRVGKILGWAALGSAGTGIVALLSASGCVALKQKEEKATGASPLPSNTTAPDASHATVITIHPRPSTDIALSRSESMPVI